MTLVVGFNVIAGRATRAAEVLSVSTLLTYALVLGAGVFVYFHWRMTSVGAGQDLLAARHAGWLTAGLVLASVNGLMQWAPLDADVPRGQDPWLVLSQAVGLALLLGGALLAEHVDVPGDPALVGGLAGLAISAGYLLGSSRSPIESSATTVSLLSSGVLLMALALSLLLLHRLDVRLWVRSCLAVAVVLLAGAQCVASAPAPPPGLEWAAVVANVVASVLVCWMAQGLLRSALGEHGTEMDVMRAVLADLRGDVRQDRELIHEVGSTIAGIATASRVIRQGRGLSAQRRARLEEMLSAELSRLERLLSARAPVASGPFEVHEVIEPLVVSHRERGLDVRWAQDRPVHCDGNPDDLAELVNILLENAARHGGGGTVELVVTAGEGSVELVVSDSGPGVPTELGETVFDSGQRGPSSPGQGLGLAIARRLAGELGGEIELVSTDAPGASFRVRLDTVGAARACDLA